MVSPKPDKQNILVVGSITDEGIMKLFKESYENVGSYERVRTMKIKNVMEKKFPEAQPDDDIKLVRKYLDKSPAVLVPLESEYSEVKLFGIITTHDVLKTVLP